MEEVIDRDQIPAYLGGTAPDDWGGLLPPGGAVKKGAIKNFGAAAGAELGQR